MMLGFGCWGILGDEPKPTPACNTLLSLRKTKRTSKKNSPLISTPTTVSRSLRPSVTPRSRVSTPSSAATTATLSTVP